MNIERREQEQRYREELGGFLSSTVLGQASSEEPQETPQQSGHGSIDGGARAPTPRKQKSEADVILDTLLGADHYGGKAWTGKGVV